MTKLSKKFDGQIISIRSMTWKEKGEEFGKVLTGKYHHIEGSSTFEFTINGFINTFCRSEWLLVDLKIAVWINEVYLWQSEPEETRSSYRQGYCDALLAVIRHSLMD